MARPLPATSMLMKIQAPVAGMLLEDVVRDTVVDKALQPFARTSKNAEALAILVGPPVVMSVIQLNPELAPVLVPVLRDLLVRMSKVAGPKMTQALAEEREFEEQYGQPVDELIGLLIGAVQMTLIEDETPEQAEERYVREAQQRMSSATAAA